jgi:hypothetical protein
MKKIISLTALSLLLFAVGYGQNARDYYVVSPLIGPKIDAFEYFEYGFDNHFQVDATVFDYAVMQVVKGENRYVLSIYNMEGERREERLNAKTLQEIHTFILGRGAPILEPLANIEKRLDEGNLSFVRLGTEDGLILMGSIWRVNDERLLIDTELGLHSIRIEDLGWLEVLDGQVDLSRNYTVVLP